MSDTPVAECTVCRRPSSDAYLCTSCHADLNTALQNIPWLVEELTITLTRQARLTERSGPRATESPLVFHLSASIDLESLQGSLTTWVHAIAHRRGVTVDAGPDSESLARWLLRYPTAIAAHPDAAELHGDILSLTEAAGRTIDRAPKMRYVGPCEDCNEDLYVPVFDNGRLPDTVICRTLDCGAEYPVTERRAWLLEQAYDRVLTAAEMSRCLGELFPGRPINPPLIRQWASRGIRVHGLDEPVKLTKHLPHHADRWRRPRYHVEEVVQIVRFLMAAEHDRVSA